MHLERAWSLALASAALVYNAAVAPAFGLDRPYRRAGEARFGGTVAYALAVVVLLAVAPLHVASGAWAVLAAADPAAALAGTRRPRPRVPWNPRKSLAGTAFGLFAGSALCLAVLAAAGVPRPLAPAFLAGTAGALAESLPLPFDDNYAIAAAAGVALALSC